MLTYCILSTISLLHPRTVQRWCSGTIIYGTKVILKCSIDLHGILFIRHYITLPPPPPPSVLANGRCQSLREVYSTTRAGGADRWRGGDHNVVDASTSVGQEESVSVEAASI